MSLKSKNGKLKLPLEKYKYEFTQEIGTTSKAGNQKAQASKETTKSD